MFEKNSKKPSASRTYLRFFLASMPLFLVVLIGIQAAWTNISNQILLRIHDRDLAVALASASQLLGDNLDGLLQTVSIDQPGFLKSYLRSFSQTPGVSCVSISQNETSIFYPPQTFCEKMEIRDVLSAYLSDGAKLSFHLNSKYLDELEESALIYNAIFLGSSFFAFVFFNYFGYQNVVAARVTELAKRNRVFVQFSPTPTAEITESAEIVSHSLSWELLFGDKATVDDDFLAMVDPSSLSEAQATIEAFFKSKEQLFQKEFVVRTVDGKAVTVQAQFAVANSTRTRAILSLTNIDEIKNIVELRTRQALTDDLTSANSRRALYEDFEKQKWRCQFWLVLIDIDDFKTVNDIFGHQTGDAFLKNFVSSLKSKLDKFGSIYRLGGEEFVFLVQKNHRTENFSVPLSNLQTGVALKNENITISRTFSCGQTLSNLGEDISDVLRRSDKYLSRAKQLGKAITVDDNHSLIFDDHPASIIHSAIDKNDIQYFMQPIISFDTNSIVACESLIRWRSDDKIVMPQDFLKSFYNATRASGGAEQRAKLFCRNLQRLETHSLSYVSYNVNAMDIIGDSMGQLINVFQDYNIKVPIVLEISEQEFPVGSGKTLAEIVKELKTYGFKIALDDFGKHESNLDRLADLEIDILKVDRSIIKDINLSERRMLVVKTLQSLCLELNTEIVAEGVENESEARTLSDLGISHHQGYYFYRPMPISDLNNILSKSKNLNPKNVTQPPD